MRCDVRIYFLTEWRLIVEDLSHNTVGWDPAWSMFQRCRGIADAPRLSGAQHRCRTMNRLARPHVTHSRSRMIGLRGRFGLMLAAGGIMRITSVIALHQSSSGAILLDVLLDHGGTPRWHRSGLATEALYWRAGSWCDSSDLAHVVAAVEFLAEETVEQPSDAAVLTGDDVEVGPAQGSSLLRRPP